ncbi:hypothetical protein V495_06490 [Pseudogymnoascus sp. VKM F-4514 (FW-929)]|nr:hypothetical protein V495_06490 [Pseudogymnoascus sp. VKM F-4514 (FW-929)]KFY62840.1 hypothetical protein V497_02207 [Pseudogymnoascus sp. VKM F-4516 (FW-969)]
MAVPKLGAGTATLPVSRESLHSVQAAQPGHEVNRATPDNFSQRRGKQKAGQRQGGLVEEAWYDLGSGRRQLDAMAHNAFWKMRKEMAFTWHG